MPSAESDGVENMWYSFDWARVHMVSINTETDFAGAGEETKGDSGIYAAGSFAEDGVYMAWLEADLSKAAAARKAGEIDFIIAGGHRPFTDDEWCATVGALFLKYGVDMYFSGHSHSYSRFTADQHQGTTHVVVGGAGNDEHPWADGEPGKVRYFTRGLPTTTPRIDHIATPRPHHPTAPPPHHPTILPPQRTCQEWCKNAGGASAAKAKARHELRAKAGLPVGETHATTDQCKICNAGLKDGECEREPLGN